MQRIGFLAALLLPLLAAAAVPGQRLAAAAVSPEFVFADAVSAEDRAHVVEGFRLAQDFYRATFDAEFREQVTFDVGPKPDSAYSAAAHGHDVAIATDNPVYLQMSPVWRVKTAIHESFHVLQHEWAGTRDWGPVWLLEGSAELVAWRALSDKGILIDGPARDRWIWSTQNGRASGIPLDQMESPSMSAEVRCCLYEVAPLAVDLLLAGPGLASLRGYYEAVGDGTPWRAAFGDAFKQTVDEFYAAFETLRWQLPLAGHDQTVVAFGTSFVPGVAELTVRAVATPIERGDQFVLVGWTAPGIACTLVFTSAGGKHLVTQPTHAGPDGTVFWLWSVRPKLARGMASVTVDCGATPITTGVEFR